MAELKVDWKPRDANTLFNRPVERIDGIEKASGFAKYSTDYGAMPARLVTSPHAHAKIKSIDLSPLNDIEGVQAAYIFPQRAPDGDTLFEINWEGTPIAAVAAETPAQAAQGAKAIKIEYEVLDYFVDEDDLDAAAARGLSKPGRRESIDGDPDEAINNADVVHKGHYGIHSITHCCLEPHGSTCAWDGDDKLEVQLSTQNVSGTGGQFAGAPEIGIDAANVTVNCEYIGGGFGSKFAADEWGIACAALAKQVGRPVQLHLGRRAELGVAGSRPSGFADVTIAAQKDGTIVAWDSHHWGTNGIKGGTVSQVPYVIQPEHRRVRTTGVITNTGPARAWRAPNHPQACALTCTAIDDLAAALGMDPLDVFQKNVGISTGTRLSNPVEVYLAEMETAAGLMDWRGKWKGRGQWEEGGWKRGLGMALHTWGGSAGGGSCTIKVHPDGTVETFAGTQDIGTGTKTCIAQIVAETFGLPLSAVQVNIGSNKYPPSGPSGGSTTIGGVSGPHRRAAIDALGRIFDKVAAKYNVNVGQLSAEGGNVVAGGKTVCTWRQATGLLGPMGLEVMGEGPKNDGLTSSGVGGVQMVDLSVDPETGRVRINKYVAVQDIGTIVNHQLAKSQVLGAMIQCIAYGLSEERIMDNASGRFINANLQDYKLPRIGDIGELVVEFYEPDGQYNKGVVGLGEPPVISGGAAISNAVANAIGVRVPVIPLTPKRILDALASA